jgi:hypothetical protein
MNLKLLLWYYVKLLLVDSEICASDFGAARNVSLSDCKGKKQEHKYKT